MPVDQSIFRFLLDAAADALLEFRMFLTAVVRQLRNSGKSLRLFKGG
jgi:hypothetical protein